MNDHHLLSHHLLFCFSTASSPRPGTIQSDSCWWQNPEKTTKIQPRNVPGNKMEFLEFGKKPRQLRFHSIMGWGSEVFPSHFTDLLNARLSTSITSPIFKKNSNSCSIALCNTSWQLMTKWEVEIGPFFFKDHCYYFTHQLSLMNCVIQPQENLLEKLFSPRELLWKPFLIVFFPDLTISLTLNPLPPPLTNLCKSIAHSLLSFPSIFPWEGLKASVQRYKWKFCTLNTVLLRLMFGRRLKYFFNHCLSVAFWSADWIWPVTDNRYLKRNNALLH